MFELFERCFSVLSCLRDVLVVELFERCFSV